MKRLLTFLLFTVIILSSTLYAQIPPNAFNYSAVARDASGQAIATSTIGIQISILQSSTTGTSVYTENHFVNTDEFGLFNLVIGAGAVQSGSMTTIDWAGDNYYLKVGMDATGGTNFLTMGTTQLLSVPYALHAATADSIVGGGAAGTGFTHYIGEEFGGGVIFHLWKDAQGVEHGLIASKYETSTEWQTTATLIGADRSWDGIYNTSLMTNSPAADYVNDLSEGGFTDWYLPSIDEMNKLFQNRFEVNIALFEGGYTILQSYYGIDDFSYWTSNEDGSSGAVSYDNYFMQFTNDTKLSSKIVRGIRKF
ncbi:DUF1566 domain-containing protein [Crocinitomicaceae bacterium]|nr:DUF1566 domain-containing protein [Crocinitomicaceae bacterium]